MIWAEISRDEAQVLPWVFSGEWPGWGQDPGPHEPSSRPSVGILLALRKAGTTLDSKKRKMLSDSYAARPWPGWWRPYSPQPHPVYLLEIPFHWYYVRGRDCIQGDNEKMQAYVVLDMASPKCHGCSQREAKGKFSSTHTLSPGVLWEIGREPCLVTQFYFY